jgi:hypothetical protein
MATKQNTSTKSLKAKPAAKRAAKKRARPHSCPVAELARKIDRLVEPIRFARERIAKEPAGSSNRAQWQERIDTLYDQARSHRTAASFLEPKSMEGVPLLLGSIDTDADNMRGSEDKWARAEWHRRLQRSLYGIVHYLDRAHGTKSGSGLYLHDDPLVNVM